MMALLAARRWSELDPLIRDAWSRSGPLSPDERISLAIVFSDYLLWTGAVDEAWSLIEAELADRAGASRRLCRRPGPLWQLDCRFRGDHEQALRYAERGLAAARSAETRRRVVLAALARPHPLRDQRKQAGRRGGVQRARRVRAGARQPLGAAVALFDVASHHGGER